MSDQFTLMDLHCAGYTTEELRSAGYTPQELLPAVEAAKHYKATRHLLEGVMVLMFLMPLAMLALLPPQVPALVAGIGGLCLAVLCLAKCSSCIVPIQERILKAKQLKAAGYTAKELKAAGWVEPTNER